MKHALLLAALLTAPAAMAQPVDIPGLFSTQGRFGESTGAAVYAGICAGCHMPNGQGATGAATYPSLANNPRLAAKAYPIAVVLHGQRAMPAFAQLLTNQQIADVVDLIRHSFGNNAADTTGPTDIQQAR